MGGPGWAWVRRDTHPACGTKLTRVHPLLSRASAASNSLSLMPHLQGCGVASHSRSNKSVRFTGSNRGGRSRTGGGRGGATQCPPVLSHEEGWEARRLHRVGVRIEVVEQQCAPGRSNRTGNALEPSMPEEPNPPLLYHPARKARTVHSELHEPPSSPALKHHGQPYSATRTIEQSNNIHPTRLGGTA